MLRCTTTQPLTEGLGFVPLCPGLFFCTARAEPRRILFWGCRSLQATDEHKLYQTYVLMPRHDLHCVFFSRHGLRSRKDWGWHPTAGQGRGRAAREDCNTMVQFILRRAT